MKTALPFYAQVLPAIGFTKVSGDESWMTYTAEGDGMREFFGFTEDPKHRPNETRISFWADTPAEVDRVAAVVKKAGGKVLEGPELCVDYTPVYYAFFWEDPDGNKLEICCRTPVAKP